ncbi:TPA: hypothetical protein NJ318_005413 [Vibrio parahaemolyticus]|nr:hypothetical protein [Vibrio parahaemolyticus]HCG6990168.1 hypothetical protein [Vibrio parahaemolyticus]
MISKLVIVLKDYSQTFSLEDLIAGNPHCFNAEKQLKLLDIQKPFAFHVDVNISVRLRNLAPEYAELCYHIDWLIDELHKLGLPKDNIVVRSGAFYILDGYIEDRDKGENELGFIIKAANADSPLKRHY